jgi:hypothetical protein
MPKIFISYEMNDPSSMATVMNWKKQAFDADISFEVIYLDKSAPLQEKEIEQKVKDALSKCTMMMVIVGFNAHNKSWIEWEVQLATSRKIPIFWCQAPGKSGGAPKGLTQQPIPFKAVEVQKEIRRIQSALDKAK